MILADFFILGFTISSSCVKTSEAVYTYLEQHRDLAKNHDHMTAKQAAAIAKEAGAQKLVLTHFSARYRDLEPFKKEAAEIFPNVECADDFRRFDFPLAKIDS